VASIALALAVAGTLSLGSQAGGRGTASATPSPVVSVVGVGDDEAGYKGGLFDRRRRAAAARVPAVQRSAGYTFTSTLDGQSVRWDPCTPIRWTANTGAGPAGGLTALQAAVRDIAAASGTTWVYVGPSGATPRRSYLPTRAQAQYPPVLIGWTDGRASDLLAGQAPQVVGMTRNAWFGMRYSDGSTKAATRAAVVALDRTDTLPLRGPGSWEAVTRHELGHAFGLGHVEDPAQLMAAVLPRTTGELQAGDLAGLARLGRRAGCVSVP